MEEEMTVYEVSIIEHEGMNYSLARLANHEKRLVVAGDSTQFSGTTQNNQLICDMASLIGM